MHCICNINKIVQTYLEKIDDIISVMYILSLICLYLNNILKVNIVRTTSIVKKIKSFVLKFFFFLNNKKIKKF